MTTLDWVIVVFYFVLVFAVAIYAFRVQADRFGQLTGSFNLLDLPWFSRLMRASLWKVVFQGLMLLIFAIVVAAMAVGWATPTESAAVGAVASVAVAAGLYLTATHCLRTNWSCQQSNRSCGRPPPH